MFACGGEQSLAIVQLSYERLSMMNKKWSSAYHCHVFEQYTIKKALGEKTIHYDMSIFLYKLRETFQMLIYQAGILKAGIQEWGS